MALKKKTKSIAKRNTTKKSTVKKRIKLAIKRPVRKAGKTKGIKEKIIGQVTHYFPKVRAAVIKLKGPLAVGDLIKIKGHTTDFQQNVTSMQIDHVPLNLAKKGQEIGLLADSRVRQHDIVYKAKGE